MIKTNEGNEFTAPTRHEWDKDKINNNNYDIIISK